MLGMTSHHKMGSLWELLCQTLSGRVHLPALVWKVGIPLGSASSMSCLYKRSKSGVMLFSDLNR